MSWTNRNSPGGQPTSSRKVAVEVRLVGVAGAVGDIGEWPAIAQKGDRVLGTREPGDGLGPQPDLLSEACRQVPGAPSHLGGERLDPGRPVG